MTRKLYIDGGINYDVENKAGVQILSSLPITAPLSSNEGFFEINSHWTYHIESFILMILYSMHTRRIGTNPFSFMIRKRS